MVVFQSKGRTAYLAFVDVLVLVLRVKLGFREVAGILEVSHSSRYADAGHRQTARNVG